MSNELEILRRTRLFKGLADEEIEGVLKASYSKEKVFVKGSMVFCESDKPGAVYVLLEGAVVVARDTLSGRRLILTQIEKPGEVFAEVYAFLDLPHYDMYAEALEDSRVLVIDRAIFDQEQNYAGLVLRSNMLNIFATKTYNMNRRIRILGSSSIREKIARFLIERQGKGSRVAVMPREEMADYLNVTRPSISREIGNMVSDGLIRVEGHELVVLDQEGLEDCL